MVLHPVDLRAIRDCAQGASAQPRGALPYSDSFGATRATGTSIVVDGDGAAGPGVYGESGGGSMRDYLSRELTVAVPADSGRFTGSEGPGDLVHALVYVPRDAAAGRMRAPLVVCCHGLGESGLRVAGVGQRLAAAGAVAVVPSFRGGGAPTAGSTTAMSVLTEIADLESILGTARAWPFIDAGRTALFGRSQGGLVAALEAFRRPAQVAALVLWYPALRLPAAMRTRFGAPSAVPPTFTHRVDGRDITLARRYALDIWGLDVDAELTRLRVPVLLVHGDRDADVPITVSERAVRLLPDAVLERVPGAAHGFGDERFADAMARTEAFLTWCQVLEED